MILKFNLLILVAAGALTCLWQACKEVVDDVSPQITVWLPQAESQFTTGDTIDIAAFFEDETQLAWVQVTLVDTENKPLLGPLSLSPNGSNYKLNAQYILNDPLLESGSYMLRFSANDGTNTRNIFVAVNVQSAPRIFMYPVVVTRLAGQGFGVYRYDSASKWKLFFSSSEKFQQSAIAGEFSQLYLRSQHPGSIKTIHLDDGKVLWEINAEATAAGRYFESIRYSYPFLYVAYREKGLEAYDSKGYTTFASVTPKGTYARYMVATNNYIIAVLNDNFDKRSYLATFHKTSGMLMNVRYIVGSPVALFHIADDNVLSVGNNGNSGVLAAYQAAENRYVELRQINDEIFKDAEQLDKIHCVIATSKHILAYRTDLNSLTVFAEGYQATDLAYDNTQRRVFTIRNNALDIFEYPSGIRINSVKTPDTAKAVHLVFNKL